MATFDGMLTEPKAVVFNSTTNEKQIIENGGDIFYGEGDVFAIYIPGYDLYISTLKELGGDWYSEGFYYNEILINRDILSWEKRRLVIIILDSTGKIDNIILHYFVASES